MRLKRHTIIDILGSHDSVCTAVAKISVTCDKCHQDAWGEAKTYGKPLQKWEYVVKS